MHTYYFVQDDDGDVRSYISVMTILINTSDSPTTPIVLASLSINNVFWGGEDKAKVALPDKHGLHINILQRI